MNIKKTRYKAQHCKRAGRVASSILSFVLVFVLVVAMLPIVSSAAYAQEEAVPVTESDASKQEAPTQEPSEETEQPTDKDLRNPPGISARAGGSVGIQPSKSGLYVRNKTKIGFAGKQWWIIGDSDASTPDSLQAPSAEAVTLFSDQSAAYGKSKFNSTTLDPGIYDNDYNGSTLQQVMTNAYNDIPTAEEKSYVIPRAAMDLQSYPTEDFYNFASPTNQNFWPLSYREYEDIGSFTDNSLNDFCRTVKNEYQAE